MFSPIFRRALLCGAGAIVFPAAPVLADSDAAEGTDPTIVVTGERQGYAVDGTTSANKTPTALIDTPQTVTVLSRDQLDDQAVQQLGDALRYVPGVVLGQGEGHRDQITLRGQSTTADFFLDGLRDRRSSRWRP